jgi:hypothetical protein
VTDPRQTDAAAKKSRPLAIGLLLAFLLSLYLTTSAGHTSSNDEELMYLVTAELVEQGSPALPVGDSELLACAGPGPCGVSRGADGRYYAAYGILQSGLAIPLYVVGDRLARLFDGRYHELITRASVTTLSALATAAAAAVVALIAIELGASPRGATMLALLYGVATIAWPYAKYFWSEPLAAALLATAVLFAIRGSNRQSPGQWALSGLAVGLAGATRAAMLVSVPALAVFLLISSFTGSPWNGGRHTAPGAFARQSAAFGAALLICLGIMGGYNALRYGSFLDTGHGLVPGAEISAFSRREDGGNALMGLYGVLLSPGKSVLLYSPPLFAAVIALPAFWRKRPKESVLLAGLLCGQLTLSVVLGWWYGEAAWGPRYLVPLIPILLLPLAVWFDPLANLGRARRLLMVSTVGLGLVIQLFAITVNYNTYILLTGGPHGPDAERRWFDPAATPLLGAPRQLRERVDLYSRRLEPGQYALAGGFYESESTDGPFPRWTNGQAAIRFAPRESGDGMLSLRLVQPQHGNPGPLPELSLRLDGGSTGLLPQRVAQGQPGHYAISVALPGLAAGTHRLELVSPTFVPAEFVGTPDQRKLGVQVREATFDLPSGRLEWVDVPVVPPLPVTAERPWSRTAFGWFYDPRVPHLVDFWPWYVAHAGLPPILATLGFIPLLGALWFGWRLARSLVRTLPRPE